ncbi:secretory immunoglobulin A-binding protein EsiB-like isoform X1 [Passer domesticus]|uniref:secretory immunoglobulin A-binding protein EsiB-like isoform X1 n=1 Tax=Passer domesticus TaxID=48849 RepID=UPI0030FF158B
MGDTKAAARWRRQGRGRADTWGANPPLGGGNPQPPSSAWSSWELAAVITAGLLLLYILLCYEDFHFHVAHVYARLGYPNAQHILGQRYLQGAGVEKNEDMAMHWFRQAAGQGHPHSSFNLALGTLRNMTVALEEGEVEKLLSVAAAHGVLEAQQLLENIFKSRNLP